jgi:hypothetical protein
MSLVEGKRLPVSVSQFFGLQLPSGCRGRFAHLAVRPAAVTSCWERSMSAFVQQSPSPTTGHRHGLTGARQGGVGAVDDFAVEWCLPAGWAPSEPLVPHLEPGLAKHPLSGTVLGEPFFPTGEHS